MRLCGTIILDDVANLGNARVRNGGGTCVMGDRGNVRVIQSDGEIWLYTHCSGSELNNIVADALLRGQSRWSDETYLTRIIFSEMIKYDVLETTGFGIGCSIGDNENDIVVVNCNTKTAHLEDEGGQVGEQAVPFEIFVNKYASPEAKALAREE